MKRFDIKEWQDKYLNENIIVESKYDTFIKFLNTDPKTKSLMNKGKMKIVALRNSTNQKQQPDGTWKDVVSMTKPWKAGARGNSVSIRIDFPGGGKTPTEGGEDLAKSFMKALPNFDVDPIWGGGGFVILKFTPKS